MEISTAQFSETGMILVNSEMHVPDTEHDRERWGITAWIDQGNSIAFVDPYATTVEDAWQRKKKEALTLGKSLYESTNPIEGNPNAYLVVLKADWARMKTEIQALTTINEIQDYVFTFTPVP